MQVDRVSPLSMTKPVRPQIQPVVQPSRRHFLRQCSALAAAASLGPVAALAGPPGVREVPVDQLSLAAFAAQLQSRFVARSSSPVAVALRLVEVQPLAPSKFAAPDASDADHEKFSLFFQGRRDQSLAQETYQFEHPKIGRFAMFIVPIGVNDPGHSYYEAVFNRPANEAVLLHSLSRALSGGTFAD